MVTTELGLWLRNTRVSIITELEKGGWVGVRVEEMPRQYYVIPSHDGETFSVCVCVCVCVCVYKYVLVCMYVYI